MRRMWINQPVATQLLHSYHGENVLVPKEHYGSHVRVYFTSGKTTSMNVPRGVLSEGWVEKATVQEREQAQKAHKEIRSSEERCLAAQLECTRLRALLQRWVDVFEPRLWGGTLVAETREALAPKPGAKQQAHAKHDWQCIYCGEWSAVPYRMCCAEGRRADMSVQENVKLPCALCVDPAPLDLEQ